jgi:hypothetical protein
LRRAFFAAIKPISLNITFEMRRRDIVTSAFFGLAAAAGHPFYTCLLPADTLKFKKRRSAMPVATLKNNIVAAGNYAANSPAAEFWLAKYHFNCSLCSLDSYLSLSALCARAEILNLIERVFLSDAYLDSRIICLNTHH